jgi:hypothetical protein
MTSKSSKNPSNDATPEGSVDEEARAAAPPTGDSDWIAFAAYADLVEYLWGTAAKEKYIAAIQNKEQD